MSVQVLSERSKRQERRQQLLGVRSQGNFLWRALHEGLLRANYLFTDHTRNALILAVFGFRVSTRHFWYPKHATHKAEQLSCFGRCLCHLLAASEPTLSMPQRLVLWQWHPTSRSRTVPVSWRYNCQ